MRALIYEGKDKVSFTDKLTVRDPADDEVLVRIVASGICHSDISVIDGKIDWPAPAVLGHEGAGVIEKVGAKVSELAPGDHVALHTLAYCGHCAHCESGHPTHCRHTLGNCSQPFELEGKPVSNFAATSTFAEYTVVKHQQAVKIDKSIPLDVACLIGCGVLTGVGSVINRAKVEAGDTAAVFGVGGIGLNVIQGLRLAGASRIIAVDLMASREETARSFGATDFIDASREDAPAKIKELLADPVKPATGGADWSFECSGSKIALQNAIASLGWGGNCVMVGTPAFDATIEMPVFPLLSVDRGLIGARYGSSKPHRDIPAYLALYSNGSLMLDELITTRYKLEDFEQAFHDLETGKLARGVFVY
ncbi:MAG: Zn-dependent alcohol dehydrogenase [Novosphingobium sp.]|nr:Zn-dependent alcohol dehydrogenase [Novosphingobium sp.]